MALTKTSVVVTNIQDLSLTPNATEGLSGEQLQAKYDKTGADLKAYINDILTAEQDTANTTFTNGIADTRTNTVVGTAVVTNEYVGGKRVYKKRIDIGTLPNNTTSNTAHGLNLANVTVMRFEGIAKSAANTILGLPHVALTALSACISIYLDTTNVGVTTGSDRSGYTGFVDIYYYTN